MRIFAFGCSLSQYFYPTWADVAIYEYKQKGYHGENWSRSGAGNQYIFTRLWEANTVHKFNKDDIILLQWSSMFREDRYHMGHGWWTPGNFSNATVDGDPMILNNFYYKNKWQWADLIHATMRDCALMASTHKALAKVGCTVLTTCFRDPFEPWMDQTTTFKNEKLEIEDVRAVLEMYKEDIKTTCPPILDYLEFGTTQEWQATRPKSVPSLRNEHEHMLLHELHPLTHEAANFVENNICKLSDKTKTFVEEWKTQLLEKDPIILEELKWFNKEKLGWSDDRWRP